MKIVTRAIIINDQGKVLLGKRARNDAIGKWALVGGKPDGDETAEKAIVREVKEELGLSFKPKLWMEEVDDNFGQGEEWKVYYFYGPADGTLDIKPDELSEVTFVSEKELENLDIAYDHKEILKKFFQQALK